LYRIVTAIAPRSFTASFKAVHHEDESEAEVNIMLTGTKTAFRARIKVALREKARMPRALHGDEWSMLVWGREPPSLKAFSLEEAPTEWSMLVWGREPPSLKAFSLEEAPTFGRGSSLLSVGFSPCSESMPLWRRLAKKTGMTSPLICFVLPKESCWTGRNVPPKGGAEVRGG
jgi:hypothetical protein